MNLLVSAPDPELPRMLGGGELPRAAFATAGGVKAVLTYKPGPIVLVVDESLAPLVTASSRTDVRVVVLVTPRSVPAVFPAPVVAVIERPLLDTRLVAAVRLALGSLETETVSAEASGRVERTETESAVATGRVERTESTQRGEIQGHRKPPAT